MYIFIFQVIQDFFLIYKLGIHIFVLIKFRRLEIAKMNMKHFIVLFFSFGKDRIEII